MTTLPDFPEEAKIAAKEKRLIVFLGAGLSSAAGLKDWNELRKDLLNQSGKEEAIKAQWQDLDFYDCFYNFRLENEKNYKTIEDN